MTPPAWADVAEDLATAVAEAGRAAAKAATLGETAGTAREDRELAIGKHLHDAYSAAEKALERLVELTDGSVPAGRSFHRDLIRRAAHPLDGVRPAIISAETAEAMEDLLSFRHVFRHAYGAFRYARAAPNVALAAAAIPRLRDEVTAFAAGLGLAPGA